MSKSKSYRKYAATTMAVAVAASAVAPVVAGAQSNSFSDVSPEANGNHYDSIIAMAEAGIITGKGDGTFAPFETIARTQVAKMLQRALNLDTPANVNEVLSVYTDVNVDKESQEDLNAIAAVTAAGIFGGDSGKFMPWANFNREQMASVLVRAYGLDKIDTGDDVNVNLSNVDASHKASVQILANLGVTTELSNYRPGDPVLREQFASFLKRTIDAVEDAAVGSATVKAINNTTVEVTFKDTISDIKALDFTIDGLDVTNAVVKQSDKKTAILTTSAQTGGETYTVSESGEALGSFVGISAVIPSAIEVTTNSTQAVVGEEATVSAEVTVPEGQEKAGIPVTFNIQTDNPGNNEGQIKEVYTDEDGVASFSYTQYYGGQDTVVAYATGDPSIRSSHGQVYWGEKQLLALTEVTEGNQFANGEKKVYEVKVNNPDGTPYNGEVNIAFEENVNVTQDNKVEGVVVTDAKVGQNQYPHQFTSGTNRVNPVTVQLTDGEATFTLSGANDAVTPIVFLDDTANLKGKFVQTSSDGKLAPTELQVKAPTVSFEATQELEIVVESLGTKNAAAFDSDTWEPGDFAGGRDYKATVRDTDGNLAPEGTVVYLMADELEGDVFAFDEDELDTLGQLTDDPRINRGHIELETDANGEVKFTLVGEPDAYAVPLVYHNNGDQSWRLDDADAQATGEIVYFGKAVLKTAVLTVLDENNKEISSIPNVKNNGDSNIAYFVYEVTDQNGKKNTSLGSGADKPKVTFQVKNTGFTNWIDAESNTGDDAFIAARDTKSVTGEVDNGVAVLQVWSPDGASSAEVDVTSSQITLTSGKASVEFTKGATNILPDGHTGTLNSINKTDKTVKVDGFNAISYADATINDNVNTNSGINNTSFEDLYDNNTLKVNVTKHSDGTYTLDIVEITPLAGTDSLTANKGTGSEDGVDGIPGSVTGEVLTAAGIDFTFTPDPDGNGIGIALDGINTNVDLDSVVGEEYNVNQLPTLVADIQTDVDTALGSDTVTVSTEGGKLTFTTVEDGVEIAVTATDTGGAWIDLHQELGFPAAGATSTDQVEAKNAIFIAESTAIPSLSLVGRDATIVITVGSDIFTKDLSGWNGGSAADLAAFINNAVTQSVASVTEAGGVLSVEATEEKAQTIEVKFVGTQADIERAAEATGFTGQ